MKTKILTSLGIAVIALALFFNTNSINDERSNLDLASLISINSANAETPTSDGWFWKEVMVEVTITESTGGSIGVSVLGTGGEYSWDGTSETYTVMKEKCVDGWSACGISHWL